MRSGNLEEARSEPQREEMFGGPTELQNPKTRSMDLGMRGWCYMTR